MEAHKPTPIEIPPPHDEASMLAFYLEGVPLVQIARALQVGVPTVLDFLRTPDVRACIEQFEESIEQQTRLCALASRIPAMATLREVCASEGSLAERRRAASDLLRQSRAAEKPAKGQRFNRTPHSTQSPDKFIPNPNVETTPQIPRPIRPTEPSEPDFGLNKPAADRSRFASPAASPSASPVASHLSPPFPPDSQSELAADQTSMPASESSPVSGSFIAHDLTASWHAFERDELVSSPPDLSAPHLNSNAVAPAEPQDQLHAAQPISPAENPLVNSPVACAPSPYDLVCQGEISTPLPDAVPVAA